jgi:hypothetical protein
MGLPCLPQYVSCWMGWSSLLRSCVIPCLVTGQIKEKEGMATRCRRAGTCLTAGASCVHSPRLAADALNVHQLDRSCAGAGCVQGLASCAAASPGVKRRASRAAGARCVNYPRCTAIVLGISDVACAPWRDLHDELACHTQICIRPAIASPQSGQVCWMHLHIVLRRTDTRSTDCWQICM